MPLNKAHEGYEYQDLLTIHFVLNEILNDFKSEFIIDKKENSFDKFDDLTIIRNGKIFKKQIKYSQNHIIEKSNLSSKGTYELALDLLYHSWLNHSDKKNICDYRLCLAWDEPTDELTQILQPIANDSTFVNYFDSKTFRVNLDLFWKEGKTPLKSWKRFNKEGKNIDRNSFKDFCSILTIELKLPKFSLNFDSPDALENIVINQVEQIGIGIYPNDSIDKINFILRLMHIIKRKRVDGSKLNIDYIFDTFKIKTDYGSIKQTFPINYDENIYSKTKLKDLYNSILENKTSILTGEPGSGKSWLVNNLIDYLNVNNVSVVKHYCYTDLEDEFQKERIKLDVFYGNLISEIIKKFPYLKKIKRNNTIRI